MFGHMISNKLSLLDYTSSEVDVFSRKTEMEDYFFTCPPAKGCLTFARSASLCLAEVKNQYLPSRLVF